ncbi:MAG: wax ester/triacylglycerol synthase family O-acyltransferase [Acidimicrobiia bacterium]
MERLTGADLAMLWPDDLGWPQDFGALAILDGEALSDPTADFARRDLQERIASRLHLVPRFRRCLHRPGFGLGWPYWADDPSFDIARHVRFHQLSAPGNEAQLLEACEMLRQRPFDMSHPLWEFWFLIGLSDGRVGMYMRVHHTLADGAAGMAALSAFFDPTPNPTAPVASPWTPSPAPTRVDLITDNLRRRWNRLRHGLESLRHPSEVFNSLRLAVTAIRRILREARAPRTSLNRLIGDRRRFRLVRSELGVFRQIAHSAGGTVNDVLLHVVAGGVADLLISRGEPIDELLPRAVVPMAGGLDTESGNNTVSGMIVPLPIGETDPFRRLQRIASETALRKSDPLSYDQAGILSSPTLERVSAWLAGRQRVSNLYVANLPGPPMRFFLGPARIHELFPLVPLVGNVTIGVGAVSYAGQFNLTIVADHDACPDVGVFVNGIRRSLDELAGALSPGGGDDG